MAKDQDMVICGKSHCSMWVVMNQYPHRHCGEGHRMNRKWHSMARVSKSERLEAG